MTEILTHDPLIAAWKNVRAAVPEIVMLNAFYPTDSRDVDRAVGFARAVSNYVRCIMLKIPEARDTIH
jgi:hypothetical protein